VGASRGRDIEDWAERASVRGVDCRPSLRVFGHVKGEPYFTKERLDDWRDRAKVQGHSMPPRPIQTTGSRFKAIDPVALRAELLEQRINNWRVPADLSRPSSPAAAPRIEKHR
jgi:hypothetical protein